MLHFKRDLVCISQSENFSHLFSSILILKDIWYNLDNLVSFSRVLTSLSEESRTFLTPNYHE